MDWLKGDFLITPGGRPFRPLEPAPADFDIGDIATGLANQGRYNGMTRHFYSVAQHSCLLADHFTRKGEPLHARAALLHDAAEAYIGDIIRPLKPLLPGFLEIERRIEAMLFERFGLPAEIPLRVKEADTHILIDEAICLMPAEAVQRFGLPSRARLGIEIRPLFPTAARDLFMAKYRELFL